MAAMAASFPAGPRRSDFFSQRLRRSAFHFNPSPLASPSPRHSSKKLRSVTISAMKIARCRPLDLQAEKHHRLRFVRKMTTLLLSKPRRFIYIQILSRHCRKYLTLASDRHRSVISMLARYPAIFRLFHAPSHTSQSSFLLAVTLTPAAAAIAEEESLLMEKISASLASKLQKLLMMSDYRRILLSKLVHLAGDLGLPPDFRSNLCNRNPNRFRTVDTSYGRALELVQWNPDLASPLPPFILAGNDISRPIIDRKPRFKQLKLRKGLNLKRKHRDYLIKFHELPDFSPYSSYADLIGESPELAERRACAVVREILGMTRERRTLVDHLTHFRKELGLPNKLRAMLVRHPEMFYVSLKGGRDSVFLVEGYDEKGKLRERDEILELKERLMELVREGKRMRKQRRKGLGYGDEELEVAEEEDDGNYEDEDEDDPLHDLFVSGVGDDWEEFAVDEEQMEQMEEEESEFWKPFDGASAIELGDEKIW